MDNIMAYYHHCRVGFTQGQKDYMRAFIANYTNNGFLTNQLTTLQSLYEPYEANTPHAYEISYVAQSALAVGWPYYWVSLNHFGYKFQKGFDYELYTWDYDWVLDNNNQLVTTNYTYSAFPSPYFTIDLSTHLFHDGGRLAIKIIQVDNNNIVPILSSINPIPGPAVTSTTLISSDINTNNMTIRELDEQESNDPNLIQNLEPQKIHTIIKHLDNGENNVKRIYKTN
jgi:hypothetical protein